jgi:hypothetical protein
MDQPSRTLGTNVPYLHGLGAEKGVYNVADVLFV